MKKESLYKILIIIGLLFTFGCEDVIELDLDSAEPRLVVDASIDWIKGESGKEQKIILSTSTDYYSEEFPSVSNAIISVTNTSGKVFQFVEMEELGEYICHDFEPEIGEEYHLRIELNDEVYIANETLVSAPNIEEEMEQIDDGGFTGEDIEVTYYYQDNPDTDNYYLHSITSPIYQYPKYHTSNNKFSQGNLMSTTFMDEDIEPGDVLHFKLYGISRRYYEYFNKILDASGNSGNPFATVPSAVRGNIVNTTNEENFVFGYFRLSEVSSRDYTIE